MEFRIENRFPLPPEDVAELLLDAELQEDVHAELGYDEWREEERANEGERLRRTLRVTPRIDLPAFVRSALGSSSSYRETQEWAGDRLSYRWQVVFDLSSLIRMAGTCRLEPVGDGEALRVIEGECKVGVPLLGSRIAGFLRDETVRTQTESAAGLIGRLEFEDEEA